MPQFNSSASIVPISYFDGNGGLVFLPPGILTSSLFVTGSALDTLANQSGSLVIEFNTGSSAVQFRIPSESANQSTDIIPLFITSSGINPRVGIGTTNPLTTLDFKDTEESSAGTELLLRSSRTGSGAQIGDSAGVINFAIDSSSFTNIKTSGSIASIQTSVDSIDQTGVTGEFVIGVSNAKSSGPVDRFKINSTQTEITGTLDVSSDISSSGALFISGAESFVKSLKVGFTTPLGTSTLAASGLVTFTDNVNLGNSAGDEINIEGITTITGNITASGNISSSGEITATTFTSTGRLTATNITASIVSASDSIITNTLTASSALVENTLQFQTQSSPPSAVAGTLYLDSNYDLFIAQ